MRVSMLDEMKQRAYELEMKRMASGGWNKSTSNCEGIGELK